MRDGKYGSIHSKPWHWKEDFNITQTNNKELNFVTEVTGNENVTSESTFIPQLSRLIPDNA
jgi:hypothetical protein